MKSTYILYQVEKTIPWTEWTEWTKPKPRLFNPFCPSSPHTNKKDIWKARYECT